MEFGQQIRRWWRSIRPVKAGSDTEPVVETVPPPGAAAAPDASRPTPLWRWIAGGAAVFLVLYYPLGSALDHRINDEVPVAVPATSPTGGSRAVALAAALIDREVNETGWVPNTPFFYPNALLRYGGNMLNFQTGLIASLGRFSLELEDQIGRTRGSSAADPDLEQARGRLTAPVDKWILRPSGLPQTSSEAEYRLALRALRSYNARLAAGEAVFDVRADNLLRVLDRIAADLGSASDRIDDQIDYGRRVLIDRRADKLYYNVKGRAYGYYVVLDGLRVDFASVIDERDGVAELYEDMLSDLRAVGTGQPAIVMNGETSGLFSNNHLAGQGFYLLRARTKMREITDILAK